MLISTKLSMPPAKARMVPRSHLLHRLSEGKDARLIVISGLAGSGKTSLVCRWIKEENLPVAWYSLDKTDSDPDVFFRYLLTALGGVDPTLLSIVEPLLQEQKRLFPKEVIPLLVEHLIDQPRDIYIVLDDYHLIRSKEIHDALSYLLDFIPPGMHIVILSRHAIPFSLSRFRVRSQIVEIPASDMKFSYEETEQFFSEIMPVNLSTPEIHELARYTEGWVGGLQLFGLSLKNKETLGDLGDILSRACQETTEYLIDEVMEGQPEKVKTFLRMTALLDRFNTDLCREITSLPDASDLIDHLYRNNLFLFPLNTERTWHRYHHLLSEAIRKGVRSSPLFTTVHKKAALWFASQGYLEDAFRHAFTSGDNEFAADLLEDHLFSLHERYEIASGLRWLAKVPHDIFMQRALLRLHECGLKFESLQLADIEATLEEIEEREAEAFEQYEGFKRTLCRDLFTYFKYAIRYYSTAPRDSAEGTPETGDAGFLNAPENPIFAGYMKIIIALNHLLQGNPVRASRALKEASRPIFASGSVWARTLWLKHTATVERLQGRLNRSAIVLEEAQGFLDRKGLPDAPPKLLLCLPMAWIHYHHNNIEKALDYALRAVDYGEQGKFARDMIEGSLLLSRIYQAVGDGEMAKEYMGRMQRLSNGIDAPITSISPEPWAARLYLALHDLAYGREWARQRRLTLDEPFSDRFIHECMALAELYREEARHDELLRLLVTLHRKCREHNMMEAVLETDIIRAGILFTLNDPIRAKEAIKGALAFAETEGHVRLFVNHAPYIMPLLTEMTRDGSWSHRSTHLASILKACGVSENGREGLRRKERDTDLTPREIEISRLIAAGLKYREIAVRTFISLDTVKTHTKHIFEKLQAKTKDQAIRRMEELGLLDNP